LNILSFRLTGQFAAFRDPSVTSNQTVYYIPSKSAIVGLLGAMIGIERDNNSLGLIYGNNYINFFSKISIGIRCEFQPRKITYYTNHRSFEKERMKPFKKELVENPKYRIFVLINNDIYSEFNKIKTSIFENKFVYSPYLGHAYCPAVVSDPKIHNAVEIDTPEDKITNCIILDESDSYKSDFILDVRPSSEKATIIIERHLHHFYINNHLEQRVLRHWIPINSSLYRIRRISARELSKYFMVDEDNEIVCMY
jgi:CRISPR-associated protein Cas5h